VKPFLRCAGSGLDLQQSIPTKSVEKSFVETWRAIGEEKFTEPSIVISATVKRTINSCKSIRQQEILNYISCLGQTRGGEVGDSSEVCPHAATF
jgi:hypothetical protein